MADGPVHHDEMADAGWERVWDFIEARRIDLGWTKERLYGKTRTSDGTYRKMREGIGVERPEKHTVIARALGWQPDSLRRIAAGGEPIEIPEWVDSHSGAKNPPAEEVAVSQLEETVARLALQVEWLLAHVEELTGDVRPRLGAASGT